MAIKNILKDALDVYNKQIATGKPLEAPTGWAKDNAKWYDDNLRNDPQWKKWQEQGRTPTGEHTASDFTGAYSALKAEDKRIKQYYELATGKTADDSVIAKYASYANDPTILSAAINKETTLAPETGKYNDKIASTVQETLGRTPTAAELTYFGKQMEQGNLDQYGLGDFLKGTSEYQNKYTDTARSKLAGELGSVDQDYLNKIQSALESKYAASGRKGASAFGTSLIQAGKDLAQQRTGYLADIGYQGALGGQESLKSAYQNRLAQMYANQQNIPTAMGTSNQRYYSQQDQAAAQAAQERLYRLSQPKQGSFLQGLAPGVVQGGLGVLGSYLARTNATSPSNYTGQVAGGYPNLVQKYY